MDRRLIHITIVEMIVELQFDQKAVFTHSKVVCTPNFDRVDAEILSKADSDR